MDVSPPRTMAGSPEASAALGPKPNATAARIAGQLRLHLDGHRRSGDAFVVSVYGEWGIGKTNCLRSLRDIFSEPLDEQIGLLIQGKPNVSLTIPVWFDPWRYEHEEHLVIPLLKTIEFELRRVQDRINAEAEMSRSSGKAVLEIAAGVARGLGRAIAVVGNVAIALASGFKFKLGPVGDVEFSVKDVVEAARNASERNTQSSAPESAEPPAGEYRNRAPALADVLAKRESLYFDTDTALRQLTEDKDAPLRLVVLIDDLDRCLPEKAVQVLESVKLFLNVRGFSFVLAVDDEVVERGIAYRYRDYPPARDRDGAGAAPISGAEYLEKIVHLPVHLQRWTNEEAADFLRPLVSGLFPLPKEPPETGDADPVSRDRLGEKTAAAGETTRTGQQRAEQLTSLVTRAIPLVPRKLIRLAEALAFQYEHFGRLGELRHWSPLHAARLVALQQLYPGLYRHLRLREGRYWRLFEVQRDEFGDPTYGDQSLHELQLLLDPRAERSKKNPAESSTPAAERKETLRERRDLLDLVEQASRLRGAPDPLLLFARPEGGASDQWKTPDSIAPGFGYEAFLRLYVHGLPHPEIPSRPPSQSHDLPVATVQDPERFLAAIFDPDAIARREFLEGRGLTGTRLPDDVFQRLVQRLAEKPNSALAGDIDWLRDVTKVTSPEQLLDLYRRNDVLNRLLDASGKSAAPSTQGPKA